MFWPVGAALPGVDVRIVDDHGRDVGGVGAVGAVPPESLLRLGVYPVDQLGDARHQDVVGGVSRGNDRNFDNGRLASTGIALELHRALSSF